VENNSTRRGFAARVDGVKVDGLTA
jgi:hypothetical protein